MNFSNQDVESRDAIGKNAYLDSLRLKNKFKILGGTNLMSDFILLQNILGHDLNDIFNIQISRDWILIHLSHYWDMDNIGIRTSLWLLEHVSL